MATDQIRIHMYLYIIIYIYNILYMGIIYIYGSGRELALTAIAINA